MQGKKHKPGQIIKKLREADAMLSAEKSIGQVRQALEVSEQTFHRSPRACRLAKPSDSRSWKTRTGGSRRWWRN